MLNYPPIYEFLKNFIPCACQMCDQRQTELICQHCIRALQTQLLSRKCVICANPNLTWVCKRCQIAKWAFDTTHSLSSENSRLIPMVKGMHWHGNLKPIAGICKVWEQFMQRDFLPVDYLIPLPEALSKTQSRGFHSHLEIAKRLAKQKNIPLIETLLGIYPSEQDVINVTRSPFKISSDLKLQSAIANKRIGIVGCYMKSEYIYHYLAQELKSLGALWVSNWIMIRIPNQKTSTCSILS